MTDKINIVCPNNKEFPLSQNDPVSHVVRGFQHFTQIHESTLLLYDEEDCNVSESDREYFECRYDSTRKLKQIGLAARRKYRIKGYEPGSVRSSESVDANCAADIRAGRCTFNTTGKDYLYQKFYRCYTCALEGNLGVCQSCKDRCHSDHHTVFAGILTAYCDCGDGNPKMKERCKCLDVSRPTFGRQSHSEPEMSYQLSDFEEVLRMMALLVEADSQIASNRPTINTGRQIQAQSPVRQINTNTESRYYRPSQPPQPTTTTVTRPRPLVIDDDDEPLSPGQLLVGLCIICCCCLLLSPLLIFLFILCCPLCCCLLCCLQLLAGDD